MCDCTWNNGGREEMYRDMLDEGYTGVTYSGLYFTPSTIIEECDPVAFRCGVNEYEDTLAIDDELYYNEATGDYHTPDCEDANDDAED